MLSAKPRNSRRQLSVVCLIIRAAFSGQDNIGIAYLFLKPDKRSKRRKSGSKLAAEVKPDSGAETACRTASSTRGDIVSDYGSIVLHILFQRINRSAVRALLRRINT